MVSSSISYNVQVNLFAESGELLGTARLVGSARRSRRGGVWGWRGQLHNTSFEAGILYESGQLRLEFSDGAVGYAFCRNIRYSTGRPTRIELTGTDMPSRAEAG